MSARVSRRHSRIVHQRRARFLQVESLEQRSLMATLSSYLTSEHADLSIGTNGSTWTISPQNSDELPAVQYSSEDGLLYVGAPSLSARPSGSGFDFIGVGEGENFYRLPQSQDPNLLYLGFAGYGVTPSAIDTYNPFTESKGRVNGNGRWIKVSLLDVQHTTPSGAAGTGKFSVWQSGDTGPAVFLSNMNDGVSNPNGSGLDATDGISADDGLWILAGGHLHYNFGFSEKGRYEVTLKTSAYFGSDGNNSTPNTADYRESGPIKLYFSVQSVGRLEFNAAGYTVNEDAGTASIQVRRVEGSDGRLTVNYGTSNGSAAAPGDYTATSGTLTFEDGETQKTIVIPILEDLLVEGNETINLTLSAPGPSTIANYVSNPQGDNSSLLGPQATAVLTIVDNDSPTNSPPTISNVVDVTTAEDVATGALAFTVGDAQTAAGALAVTATSSNTLLVPNANILLGGSGANRTVTLTPAANQFGTTTITLTVTDAGGLTATDTFLVTVDSVNDLPTISDVPNQTTLFNTPVGPLNFTIGDTETAAGLLTVSAVAANPTLVPNANLALGGSGSNRTLTVTPAAGQSGTTTITVTVTDADGGTRTDTFDLTVGANAPPTISDIPNQSTSFNTPLGPLSFTVGDTETAANLLSVSAVSSNTTLVPNVNLSLGGTGTTRTLTVTPATGQSGTTTITVTVTDADGGVQSDTFELVVGTSTLPTISDITNRFVLEGQSTGAIPFTVGDVETAVGDLVVTATSSNQAVIPNSNIVLGGSGANRTATITSVAGQYGPTTITLTVTDGNGAQTSDTFVLTVTANSLVPFAVPATFSISKEDGASSLASADFNGDGKIDVVSVGSFPGSLVLLKGNGDGTFQAGVSVDGGSPYFARTPFAVDYDGDGDVDLLTREFDAPPVGIETEGQVAVHLNDRAGNFTRQVLVGGLTLGASAIQVGELNGDGRPDFIRWANSTTLVYHESLPGGGYAPPEVVSSSFTSLNATRFQLEDIDADGDLDILAYDTTPRRLSIFRNDGAGNFGAPQQLTFAASTTVRAVADITGDGRPDILATDTATVYYAQNSDGTFGARTVLSSIGSGVTRVVPTDLNQDGVVDLVFIQSNSPRWAAGRGNGTFGATQVLWASAGVQAIIAPDLDADGDLDIVVGTSTTNTAVTVLENLTGENPMWLIPPAARTYLGGDQINLQVHFGFPIAVTGTPRLALQIGTNTVYANYVSGTGTPTLTFRYTVGATDVDLDGVQLASNTIDLNGGTLTDPEGGAAVLAFPGALAGVIVNAPGPVVQMVSRLDSAATSAGTVRFAVQFAEDVTGVDATDFAPRTTEGNLTGAVVQSVTGSGSLYEVTVSTGTGSGTLGLTVLGSAGILDLNGDAFSMEYAGGQVYTVRKQPVGTIDTFYTDGHADYRPVYSNGEFDHVWHGDPGVLPQNEYSSNELITYLDNTALVTRAAGANFDFLGVNEGEQFYLSSASGSVASVPFMGISGEGLKANVFADYKPSDDSRITSTTLQEYVKVQMVGMRSSSGGEFSLYSSASGNPTVWMATNDDIVGTDNIWTYPGTHAHYNTAFSKPGKYEIDVVISGYLDLNANNQLDASDVYVESGIKTMVFHVDTLGARDDQFTVVSDGELSGIVTANDPWHEGIGQFTASVATAPTKGALTLQPDGSFTYQPSVAFDGTDSFTYRLTNERGGFTTATVTLTEIILPSDFTVAEDSGPTVLDVLVNDTLGQLTITSVAAAPGGTIEIAPNGRSLIYTPNPDFYGTEWLLYTVTDEHGSSSVTPLTITVLNTPDAPTTTADIYSVDPARSVFGNVLFNDSDADGDSITATLVTSPTRGALTFASDGSFRYTPGSTFVGTDSFTYSASDGGLTSGIVTVTINLAPSTTFDAYLTEGHADVGIAIGAHDHDGGGGHEEAEWDLHVHDEENDVEYEPQEAVFVVGSAALTARPANPAFDFVGVAAGQNYYRLAETENPELPYLGLGTEEIEAGTFLSGTLTLRLKAVNGPGHFSLWKSGDTGPEVFMTTSDGITAADQIELLEGGHSHANWGFSARGTYEVVFQAFGILADGDESSSEDVSYFFTVNSAPEADDDAYTTVEETVLTVPAGTGLLSNDQDADGDSLVSTIVQGPANGSVTVNSNGSFTYVPNPNFSGTDTFTYAVTDQRYRLIPLGTLGGNNSFANDVNNHRQVTGNSSLIAGSSNPLQTFLWQNGTLVPLGVLPGTGSNNFSRGYAVNDNGIVVGESDNNTSLAYFYQDGVLTGLTRLAGDNFRGVSTDVNSNGVIVGASSNGSATRPTIWTLNGTNYVAADLGTIAGTTTSTGRAWAINDAGQVVGLSQNPEFGTSQATLWENGVIVNLGSLGNGERFSQAYSLNNHGDIVGASSTGQTVGELIGTTSTTSITRAFYWHDDQLHELLPYNFYAPGNTGATTNYHSEAKDINDAGLVVGNSQRIAGLPAVATIWDHDAAMDLNALISAGSGWVLRSAEGVNQGGDIVGFGAFGGFTRAFLLVPELVNPDGRIFSQTATVTITVTPTADPPVAADDAYRTKSGDVLHGNVLFNDRDPDGDVISVTASTQATKGNVVLDADGSFVYTPGPTFDGTDSFTYTISDGLGGTDTATVNITLAVSPSFSAVLSEGHVDIGIFAGSEDTIIDHGDHTHVVEGDFGWDLHVHDEETDTEYEAGDALLHVKANALTSRSGPLAVPAFDFLGVAGGDNFYRLPQSQNPELLFLGFGTEEIEDGVFAGGTLSLRLISVSGPGHVSVWSSRDTGPEVWMATADGVTTADLAELLEGGHTHVNWGFSAPGRYEVTFQALGTLADGSTATSDATTYHFEVSSGSLTATLAGSVLSILDTADTENSFDIHTANGWLVITDPTEVFGGAPPGAVLSNGNHTLSIPLAGLTAVQVNAAGGGDRFELGNTNGLPLVTLTGGNGDDQFLLPQVGGLTNVVMLGGSGSDSFGSSTQPVRLSNQATIQLFGDNASVSSNPGGNVTDHLYLDLNTTAEGATTLPLVIVDTVSGQASTANTNMLRFGGFDDIDLFDGGSLTDVEIGDLYLRAGNQSDAFVFYSEMGGVRANYNGVTVNNALYTPTKRIVAYGRGGNDYFEFNFTLGSTLSADFRGEEGNDTLVGGLGNDILVGGGGSDILRGGEGNDILFGDDFLTTTSVIDAATQRASGVSVLGTVAGNDVLQGGGGNDTLFGGGGNDDLAGGLGNDYVHGGDGNDTLNSNDGNDILRGEAGNDLINGGVGIDIILGGAGDDRIFGRGNRDFMLAGFGADQLQDDDTSEDVSVSGGLSYDADNLFTLPGASITGLNDNDLALQALMFTGGSAWSGSALFETRVAALGSPFGAMTNDNVMDMVIGHSGASDYIVHNNADWQLNTNGDTLLTL